MFVLGGACCPEAEGAVNVNPCFGGFRERNQIAKRIESAGVNIAGLQENDRWR